jgi:hypothetical protein
MNKHVPFIWRVNYRNEPRAPETMLETAHEKARQILQQNQGADNDDDEVAWRGNCRRAIARDFGNKFWSTSVTAPVGHTCLGFGEGRPWCRVLSVARASIRSQGHFGLSVWPGDQLPLSGPPLWRSR